ncbi:MAG: hypothetical protein P8Z79_26010, partial [Sedimentisphaerales bacterium]
GRVPDALPERFCPPRNIGQLDCRFSICDLRLSADVGGDGLGAGRLRIGYWVTSHTTKSTQIRTIITAATRAFGPTLMAT